MKIKFSVSEIQTWAGEYLKNRQPRDLVREARIETVIALEVRLRGYFTRPELLEVCRWKTPRGQARISENTDEYIQTVTRSSFSSLDERFRIEVLTLLDGISWSGASMLLHFGHTDRYPILDPHSLWSVGVDPGARYDFSLWQAYTIYCRELADTAGVSMRTLDRALRHFSVVNEKH